MVRSTREMRAQRARTCRARTVVRDAHARHPRASRARDKRDSTRTALPRRGCVGAIEIHDCQPRRFDSCAIVAHESHASATAWARAMCATRKRSERTRIARPAQPNHE